MDVRHHREFVELLSARLDGELSRSDERRLDDHLAGCAACSRVAERFVAVDRTVRVRPAEAVPDLRDAVLARSRPARLGRSGWMRPGLAWVAVVLAFQSVIVLVGGQLSGADVHQARHLGAFGLALAIGFAYVAWRPHRAIGLLPFATALMLAMLLAAVVDVIDGGTSVLAESVHLAEVIGLVMVWAIAGSPRPSRPTLRPA